MALSFPNRCRFYEPTRRAVRFEHSFFVTEEALKRLQPNVRPNEDSLLVTFDLNRDRREVATKVYARGRWRSYDVVLANF